ncbi:Glycine N-methyltransferase, partial [Lamellibrachia satsuma]
MVVVVLTQIEKGLHRHTKSAGRTPQSLLVACFSSLVRRVGEPQPHNHHPGSRHEQPVLARPPTYGIRGSARPTRHRTRRWLTAGIRRDLSECQQRDYGTSMPTAWLPGCGNSSTDAQVSGRRSIKQWLTALFRENGCKNILDIACGTGVDSVMLLEEGFNVSTDASDKMLKYALKERWRRRKEEVFDKWVIEEADWMSLSDDLSDVDGVPEGGFDAVLCMGNSFSHLPDFEGTLHIQKVALSNFRDIMKPGGILVVDHRNFDDILTTGYAPANNIYNV